MLFPEAVPLTCQLTNQVGLPWGLSGFPGGSDGKVSVCNAGDLGGWGAVRLSGKESACSAGDAGSIPGSGRSPGEGNGNPLQYSCLENPMDKEAWWAAVHGVTKSWM